MLCTQAWEWSELFISKKLKAGDVDELQFQSCIKNIFYNKHFLALVTSDTYS